MVSNHLKSRHHFKFSQVVLNPDRLYVSSRYFNVLLCRSYDSNMGQKESFTKVLHKIFLISKQIIQIRISEISHFEQQPWSKNVTQLSGGTSKLMPSKSQFHSLPQKSGESISN